MALITSHVAHWAAVECEKQRSGERSVAWMLDGWLYAHRHRKRSVQLRDVLALGRIVEPRHNLDGLRRVGVRVGWDVKIDWQSVPAALDQLLALTTEFPTDEWYRQYEEVHPFRDGNGRTGGILWNWRRGTLGEPEAPPDFWTAEDEHRDALAGREMLRRGMLRKALEDYEVG